ncbi:MAG: L,D-transpeptidase [Proteobacteria bacterium]|nr:L,D-transpeptidase [Pseudomonadota bacterium]
MRRLHATLLAVAFGAALAPAAVAYEIDPLTREPIEPYQDTRAKATPVPREEVAYSSKFAPGTIVVSTVERRLYYILGNGRAIRYGVGVGRPGFEWGGTKAITRKAEWPDWTPPPQMLKRRPDLPRHMKGGPENPLGARALYLGSSLYRIHGSNEPETIGQAVSSGCIRMLNDDVVDLYDRVKVGTRVVVVR